MAQPRSLVAPGLLLGIGLGGFVDGIVLHQLLQWHHMLSHTSRYPTTTVVGLQANTVADGLFHAASWVAVVTGVVLLSRRTGLARGPGALRGLVGLMLAGWGLFNLVEGVVDHHILAVHHVREVPNPFWYDVGFLAFGLLLMIVGAVTYRTAARSAARRDGDSPVSPAHPR